MKVAIIGAGSTYTPELIEGIIQNRAQLGLDEVAMMDIDAEKLRIVGGLAVRMLEKAQMRCRTLLTEDLDEALCGADYVLAQIRVGRLPARYLDETIPLKYGLLGQETTGIGGFSKLCGQSRRSVTSRAGWNACVRMPGSSIFQIPPAFWRRCFRQRLISAPSAFVMCLSICVLICAHNCICPMRNLNLSG